MSSEPVVLGIDVGATASRAAVVSPTGIVLGTGHAGPGSPLVTEEARRLVASQIRQAATRALEQAARRLGTDQPELAGRAVAVHAGLTGAHLPEREVAWLRETLAAVPGWPAAEDACSVTLSSDLDTAMEGALGLGQAGILVYAGTGSVARGRTPSGEHARAGGHGYLIDDRGGGFDLGREALQAVVRAWDGRGRPTSLVGLVAGAANALDWDSLRQAIYGAPNPKAAVAGIAPLVTRAALDGDPVAREILDRAGEQLALLARALLRRLPWPDPASTPVRFGGGAFRSVLLEQSFREALQRSSPGSDVARGLLPPIGGAVLLALRAAGLTPAESCSVTSRLQMPLGQA